MNVYEVLLAIVYILIAYLIFKYVIYWIDKIIDGGKKK